MRWLRERTALLLFLLSVTLLLAGGVAWLSGAREVSEWAWVAGTLGLVASLAWTVDALRLRQPSVDVIAVVALAGARRREEPFAGAMIGVMLTTGRLLEALAARRASRELGRLVARSPRSARRRLADRVEEVPRRPRPRPDSPRGARRGSVNRVRQSSGW